jgi:hypothetical protein
MTCQEFWISDHGETSGHLEECAACAAAWDREQALLLGLRIVKTEQNQVQASARVEGRLIAAFRGYAGLAAHSGLPSPPAWMPAVSAAAALAIAAVLLVRSPEPKPVRKASPNAMHFAAAPTLTESAPAVSETEMAEGEFIPLPNAGEFDAGEEMNLVRLEFPRSAMLALGFEVGDESEGEPVSADVMIGPDGVARAVRFLEE